MLKTSLQHQRMWLSHTHRHRHTHDCSLCQYFHSTAHFLILAIPLLYIHKAIQSRVICLPYMMWTFIIIMSVRGLPMHIFVREHAYAVNMKYNCMSKYSRLHFCWGIRSFSYQDKDFWGIVCIPEFWGTWDYSELGLIAFWWWRIM